MAKLSFLERDPSERTLRTGWMIFIAWGVIGGSLTLAASRIAGAAFPMSIVLTSPLWAMWLLWLLWRGQHGLRTALREEHWKPWQGRYYEFDGRHVRVLVDDEERIWVGADEVFDILGLKSEYQRRPARVRLIVGRDGLAFGPGTRMLAFTEKALMLWLGEHRSAEAGKLKLWFERQVVAPIRKRAEIESHASPASPTSSE